MIFQEELIRSLEANAGQVAIEAGAVTMSYSALLSNANRITRYLLDRNLEKETLIGIRVDDRPQLICSIIGVINARCIFVPIDGSLPPKRLASVIRNLDLEHVIMASHSSKGALGPSMACAAHYFLEDMLEESPEAVDMDRSIQYPAFSGSDNLYVYFTSGSTGVPKGIIGRNDSLLQFLQWEIGEFSIGSDCRFSQFISPYFDAFLRDIFVPLLTGGTICIPPDNEDFLTPEKIVRWIDTCRITEIHCVPSLFRIINQGDISAGDFKTLNHVFLSGEKILPSELVNWYKIFDSAIELVNFYGATETTMIRSFYRIKASDTGKEKIPIGRPIGDTELLVAGRDLKPGLAFVPGELLILSNYTTRGYLNDPELTHEKFIKVNPCPPEERIAFRTGDKARMLTGGIIELMGREDSQIKLNGIRIELDEIEAVLVRSPAVRHAIVISHKDDNANETLKAFVIPSRAPGSGTDLQSIVRAYLKESLPEYMIPSVREVDEFPLLGNGKIDYKKLLDSAQNILIVPPANRIEEKILSVWKGILGDKPMSTEESFHAMGGNSINMMKLIGKLYREFNIRISLNDLFNNLTIKKQAELISRSDMDNLLKITRSAARTVYPLSSAQERIYYHYMIDNAGTAFNLPMAWEIDDAVSVDKVEKVLGMLINRHESLRTEFKFVNGKLVQTIREAVDLHIEMITTAAHDIPCAIAKFVRPFDPGKAPVIRCGIIAAEGARRILIMDTHHIVCDGMSQVNLFSDFLRLYHGERLPELPVQYKDYAEWEHNYKISGEYSSHREFWLRSFEGEVPGLDLPVTNAYTADAPGEGGNIYFDIEKSALKPLSDLFKKEEITHFSGFISIFFLFLSQLSGQEDIVIGINTSGRMQDELDGVVGMFAKTLPIRYRLSGNGSFKDMAKDVHKYLMQAQARQLYDLSDMLRELNNGRAIALKSLFNVMFVFLDFGDSVARIRNDEFSNYAFPGTTSKYPITLFAAEDIESFRFRVEYSTVCFTKADIELLFSEFQSLVREIAENPMGRVAGYAASAPMPFPYEENQISFNL